MPGHHLGKNLDVSGQVGYEVLHMIDGNGLCICEKLSGCTSESDYGE
jgi:hypothetical protein